MKCDQCGRETSGIPFTCNECGQTHCHEHRLPEAHNCRGVKTNNLTFGEVDESPQNESTVSNIFWFIISLPVWIFTNIIGFAKFTWNYPASGVWKLTKFGGIIAIVILVAGQAGIGPIQSPQDQVVSPITSNIENTTDTEIDEERTEKLVREEINTVREQRGLSRLGSDADVARIAQSHSADMAARDELAHDLPGSTADQRLATAGCRPGGENVAQTWVYTDVETEDGIVYIGGEEELAGSLRRQWMNSPGHRENIVRSRWSVTGIGIEVTDENKVYATQMFCA